MTATNARVIAGAVLLTCAVAFALPAFAQGKGNKGGSNLNSNGVNAIDRDTGLNRSDDRRSGEGRENSNNPGSLDRDTGAARAQDRSHK